VYAAGVATEIVKVAVGGRHGCCGGSERASEVLSSAQVDWMCRVGLVLAAGVAVAVLRIRGVPSRGRSSSPGR
jgi:hypothetical protein